MTFLDLFERFCELTVPEIYKNNRFAIRTLGCMVLNTAARVWIKKARSLPGNMFIALLGTPRTGKSSLMSCVKATIIDSHIAIYPRSTPEALAESVNKERVGILFWDEFEEVYKKSKEYMNTFSNLINQMYYLEDVSFYRTTKPKINLQARSYYFSALVACLPQQWKAIESSFMGGFERRWLTLNIKGKLPLFWNTEPTEEAAKILAKLTAYLKELENKVIIVESVDLSKYEAEIEKRISDPLKQSVVAEYLEKIVAAEIVNSVLDDIVQGTVTQSEEIVITPQSSQTSHTSQASHKTSQISRFVHVTLCDVICDNMGRFVTCDENKNSPDFFLVRHISDLFPLVTNFAEHLCTEIVLKYDILNNLVWNVAGVKPVEEIEMAYLIEKINNARKEHVAVTMKDFVWNILGTRNAQWYKPRVEALIEAEVIRVIEYRNKKIVILDPYAPICGNCRKWDGLPCDASKGSLSSAQRDLYSPLDECRYPEWFEPC